MAVSSDTSVVVTGLGPIASLGIGKFQFWKGVESQNIGLQKVQRYAGKDLWDEFFVHRVSNFNVKNFGFDQDDLDYISNWKNGEDNIDLHYLLAAGKLALDDSKYNYRASNNKLALVVTHENPCLEQLLWKMFKEPFRITKKDVFESEKSLYDTLYDRIIKVGYETQSFMMLFHIARMFHVHEYSLFVNNACASGLYAIEAASDMLRLGKAKAVLVVGGDYPDIFKHLWFKKLDMYPSDGLTRPFAKVSKGFVMGEGAMAILLENRDHAINRNAKIYAEYLGGGFRLEGWGITSPMIGSKMYHEAIERALNVQKVKRGEIDLICAHGVGTSASDYYEARGIEDVFRGCNTPVTALKPFVGHNLGGSTLIELAILFLCMENSYIPPVLNINEINEKININIVREAQKKKIKTILKTCSAFAGYNAASIFRKE